MATPPTAATPNPISSYITAAAGLPEPKAKLEALIQRYDKGRAQHIVDDALDNLALDTNAIAALMLTEVNGSAGLPEQKVQVEYLRQDQRLMIPMALGMNVNAANPGWTTGNNLLRLRYHKVHTKTQAELYALLETCTTSAEIQTAIDALQMPVDLERYKDWFTPAWAIEDDGSQVSSTQIAVRMGVLSQMLQFNCDLRDFGFLLEANSSVSDSAWMDLSSVREERLTVKLNAFSLQCIAAMNLSSVAGFAFSAWVRSYGLALGVLPSQNSATVREYSFTGRMPKTDDVTAIAKFESNYQANIGGICGNALAMFGFMHLNKDHTYKSSGDEMDRIGTSYIRTLRTAVNENLLSAMDSNKESILRTASHPFGLAQTYWLGLAMAKFGKLASPLAIRCDVTPPPVQRVFITNAAAMEWAGLPAGKILNNAYAQQLTLIKKACEEILKMPPAYSGLHRLYGIADQLVVPKEVTDALEEMKPAIYSYIKATHTDERNVRDGLGLAMSLQNVERDSKGLMMLWKSAWEKYITDSEKDGLAALIAVQAPTEPAP